MPDIIKFVHFIGREGMCVAKEARRALPLSLSFSLHNLCISKLSDPETLFFPSPFFLFFLGSSSSRKSLQKKNFFGPSLSNRALKASKPANV